MGDSDAAEDLAAKIASVCMFATKEVAVNPDWLVMCGLGTTELTPFTTAPTGIGNP